MESDKFINNQIYYRSNTVSGSNSSDETRNYIKYRDVIYVKKSFKDSTEYESVEKIKNIKDKNVQNMIAKIIAVNDKKYMIEYYNYSRNNFMNNVFFEKYIIENKYNEQSMLKKIIYDEVLILKLLVDNDLEISDYHNDGILLNDNLDIKIIDLASFTPKTETSLRYLNVENYFKKKILDIFKIWKDVEIIEKKDKNDKESIEKFLNDKKNEVDLIRKTLKPEKIINNLVIKIFEQYVKLYVKDYKKKVYNFEFEEYKDEIFNEIETKTVISEIMNLYEKKELLSLIKYTDYLTSVKNKIDDHHKTLKDEIDECLEDINQNSELNSIYGCIFKYLNEDRKKMQIKNEINTEEIKECIKFIKNFNKKNTMCNAFFNFYINADKIFTKIQNNEYLKCKANLKIDQDAYIYIKYILNILDAYLFYTNDCEKDIKFGLKHVFIYKNFNDMEYYNFRNSSIIYNYDNTGTVDFFDTLREIIEKIKNWNCDYNRFTGLILLIPNKFLNYYDNLKFNTLNKNEKMLIINEIKLELEKLEKSIKDIIITNAIGILLSDKNKLVFNKTYLIENELDLDHEFYIHEEERHLYSDFGKNLFDFTKILNLEVYNTYGPMTIIKLSSKLREYFMELLNTKDSDTSKSKKKYLMFKNV